MNPDQAIAIVANLLRTTFFIAGPILAVSLVTGVFVALLQTATQVNEASISFLAKVIAVVIVALALGPQLATYELDYARANFEAVAGVVR
ncbi:MAG: flagellar biosynthetic protein FliQ [Polyangiaceae bacterium]|jgi:flagellar biosynthetic protein FliQ